MDSKEILNKIKSLRKEKIMQEGGIYPQPYEPYVNPLFDYQVPMQPNLRYDLDTLSPTGTPNIGMTPYVNPMNDPFYAQQQMNLMTDGVGNSLNPVVPESDINTILNQPTPVQYNINNRLFNPYSGVNIEGALFNLGRSFQYEGNQPGWNTARGIASAGKILTGGARTLFAGAANQEATQDSYQQYLDRLYNTAPAYQFGEEGGYMGGAKPFHYLQEGGEVSNAAVATGAYVVPSGGQGNVELEKNEMVQIQQTGDIQKVVGDTHENGGVKTQLPPSKVLSDHTKVGAKNAKYFREELDLKVKATDTFASVMDKYNTKIGWNDLIEQEEKTIEEIGNQEQSSIPQDTRDINLNYLSTKLQDLNTEKETAKGIQDEAFSKIFDKQEMIPKKGQQEEKMQEGGMYDPNIIALSQAYGVEPDRVLELMNQLQNVPQYQAGGFFTPSEFAQASYGQQPFLAGTTNAAGIENEAQINARLQQQVNQLPYIINQSGIYADNAANLSKTADFQRAYDEYVGQTLLEIQANPYLTNSEKKQYSDTATSQLLSLSNQEGQYDAIYGQETSSRTGFTLPYLTAEDREKFADLRFVGDAVDEKGQIKKEYSGLDPKTKELISSTYERGKGKSLNIGLGVIPTQEAQRVEPQQQNVQPVTQNVTRYSNANLPVDFILPPSGAQPVLRQQANLSRLTPTKVSAEPALANIQSQTNTAIDSVRFLPDSQRTAAIASLLGTSQASSNQAIGQTEATNLQSLQQINQFNAQQADKEQLLNLQLDADYQDKMYATLNNTERDVRSYFQDLNNQQFSNFQYIDRRNLLNQATPQFYNANGEVMFQDSNGNVFTQMLPASPTANMTPEAQRAFQIQTARNLANQNRRR